MALTALGGTSGGAMSTSTTGVPPTKAISDDEIRSLLDHIDATYRSTLFGPGSSAISPHRT